MVIEGVAIMVVGELVVCGRELLKALGRDASEIASKFCVLCEDQCPASHQTIDQCFLHHLLTKKKNPKPNPGLFLKLEEIIGALVI